MKENLTTLVDLQRVDKELQALEALKGDLPQQVEVLKAELDANKNELGHKSESLAETKKNRALLEGELNVLQEKLDKYREQLYAVTSNREYDAITVEIDTIKEKISETEDQILALIEAEETLTAEIGEIEPNISTLQENLVDKEKELSEKIQATEAEYELFEKKRKELSTNIAHSVLYQYERIRKGLGNTVVADIQNGSCAGCFSAIPPQKQVEIRTMNELIMCEYCGRILVFHRRDAAVVS